MSNANQRRPRLSMTSLLLGTPIVPPPPPKKSRKSISKKTTPVSANAPPAEEPKLEPAASETKSEEAKSAEAEEDKSDKEPHYSIKKLEGGQIQVTDKRTGDKTIFKDAKDDYITIDENGQAKIVLRIRKKDTKDKEIDISKKAEAESKKDKKVEKKAAKAEKKTEEPKSGEKEEEVKMPGQWESEDWSAEQDATITKMKGENKSWKDIAIEVGASKKDVQNRFKELQAADAEKKDDAATEDDGGLGGMGGLFDEDDTAEPDKEEKAEKPKEKHGKKQGKQKNNNHNNQKEKKSEPEPASPAPSEEAVKNSTPEPPPAPTGLKADEIWTVDDCNILEMLKERYEQHKWQHMQAGFYNFTGRMIGAELIAKKFADDGIPLGS